MTTPTTNETMALTPYEAHNPGLVTPLVDPSAAKAAISQYEALKAAIVRKDDVQRINGRDFLKKAFWRRVATCFGLSLELVSQERGFDEQGHLFYSVMYKAVAPNGRTMDADGYCSTAEPGREKWPEHNVRATAHTRAKNRAISDLVGGGEVSAEEMPDHDRDEPRPAPQRPIRAVPAAAHRAPVYAVPSEPVEPVEAEESEEASDTAAYDPGTDSTLTRLLLDVGVDNIAAVELFAQDARHNYPKTPIKAACYKELARRKMYVARAARDVTADKAPVPASLASLKTGKRGN